MKDDDAQEIAREREEKRQAQAVMASATFDARTVSMVILAVLAVFYTLYAAAEFVLPLTLAIVLNLLLSPAMRFLTSRLRFPRLLAALLLIVVLFGVVAVLMFAISFPASEWIKRAPEAWPEIQKKVSFLAGPIDTVRHAMTQLKQFTEQGGGGASSAAPAPAAGGGGMPSGVGAVGGAILSGTKAFLGQIFTVVLILFFLLSAGDSLLHRLVEVLPTFADKRRAVAIAREIEGNISMYLATITVMNLLVGVLNGLQVWLFGMGNPLLWGTVAFLLNYIPILGPLTGVVIFLVVGLLTFSSPLFALVPAGAYLLIHILEGETITPMLLARRFTLNPLLVILSLFFWDWLWGVPGAFLSVPLLAVFKIFCDHIESLTPIGHMLGESQAKPKRV
ncbi:MAG: AI-2E family transporter [Janthinobacterium lividum]